MPMTIARCSTARHGREARPKKGWSKAALILGMVGLARESVSSAPGSDLPPWTLLYTTDTQGYLQVCGCSQAGWGGLDRRATWIQQVRAQGSRVLVVDSGNLAPDMERARVVLAALARLGYHAVGLGALDLSLEPAFWDLAQAQGIPLLASPPRPPGLPPWVPEFRIQEVGPWRIGVLALTPLSPELKAEEALALFRPVLDRVRGGSEAVVLLSQWDGPDNEWLARHTEGALDLIIGRTKDRRENEPIMVGTTALWPPYSRGQKAGQIKIMFQEGRLQFQGQMVPLDDRFAADPEIQQLIEQYYAEQAETEAAFQRDPGGAAAVESMVGIYAPAERCEPCHPGPYAAWRKSPHAQAVSTLGAKGRLVPECLLCHSEQYRRTGGFRRGLREADSVQCSTCHGDGVLHALWGKSADIVRSRAEAFCRTCHDSERDPGFVYAEAFAAIHHLAGSGEEKFRRP